MVTLYKKGSGKGCPPVLLSCVDVLAGVGETLHSAISI